MRHFFRGQIPRAFFLWGMLWEAGRPLALRGKANGRDQGRPFMALLETLPGWLPLRALRKG